MTTAISVEALWKQYALGRPAGSNTFYEKLSRLLRPTRDRPHKAHAVETFWALRDVTFSVDEGDVLGIVGRNGAGKSTLLKVLSRITSPTRGQVTIRGRVASLLEVGTGFHPELTGRENIYLNGAILGMSRSEIRSRFDEIVAFSEVEQFLDTPIKRYSSGMHVRLAFAVAAHLDPDVLIVDEVLAVGDVNFQRKSLGKMQDAARGGRTVLFVSHNLGAVRNLCRSIVLLEAGALLFSGEVGEGLAIYEKSTARSGEAIAQEQFRGPLSDRLRFDRVELLQNGEGVAAPDPELAFTVLVHGTALRDFPSLDLSIGIFREGFHLASCHDAPLSTPLRQGPFVSRFHFAPRSLRPGRYLLGIGAIAASGDWTWGGDLAAVELTENWGDPEAARNRGSVNLSYEAERSQ